MRQPDGKTRGHGPSRRAARVAAVASLLTMIMGALAFPLTAAPACSTTSQSEWTSLSPSFSAGASEILDYAVSPSDPDVFYVINDRLALVTRDGGCSFKEIFNLATAELSYGVTEAAITDIDVAWAHGPKIAVAIRAYESDSEPVDVAGVKVATPDVVVRPHVVTSSDGGGSWREEDEGLVDALGPPMQVVLAPSDGTMYLLVDRYELGDDNASVWFPQALWARPGSSWQRRARFGGNGVAVQPLSQQPPRVMDGVALDPLSSSEVWLYGSRGLFHSTNGGSSNQVAGTGTTILPTGTVDVFRAGRDPAHVIAFASNQALINISDNGGQTFLAHQIAGVADSADHGPTANEFGFTTGGNVFWVTPGKLHPVDVSDADKAITGLQGVFGNDHRILYGRTRMTIERRQAPDLPPPEVIEEPERPPPPPPIDLDLKGKLAELMEPRFFPRHQRVELEPGETETLKYRLLMPGVRKVDIAFLVDLSASMKDEIRGLQTSMGAIAERLIGQENIHAYFGVGGYRNYREPPAYQRYYDVGPPGKELEQALERLDASGGNDEDETALTALYQLATGEGENDTRHFVPANQQMNFRKDAGLRIVVHGTDEALSEDAPRPSFERVGAALRGVRAMQVGLAFLNPADPSASYLDPPPRPSLETVARLTGAFAPATGVDCDGDGTIDLAPGAPLVCELGFDQSELATEMGKAIVELVKAIEDRRDISLRAVGDPEIVVGIAPPSYPLVDFAVPGQRNFEVTVTCPEARESEHDVKLQAVARGVVIARASAEVVCSSPAMRAVPQGPRTVAAGAPPLPPPARPPQLSHPGQPVQGPVTQTQAQGQAQSQAQAQGVMVAQKQEQPQVAMVHVDTAPAFNPASQSSDDLMMTSYTETDGDYPLPLYVGGYAIAGAIAAAFGLVYGTRTRTARSRVRYRTRTRSY